MQYKRIIQIIPAPSGTFATFKHPDTEALQYVPIPCLCLVEYDDTQDTYVDGWLEGELCSDAVNFSGISYLPGQTPAT